MLQPTSLFHMMNISWYREMLGCWSFIRDISCTEREQSVSVSTALLHVPTKRWAIGSGWGRDVCEQGSCAACWGEARRLVWDSRVGTRRGESRPGWIRYCAVTVRKVLRKQTQSGSRNGLLDSVARWAIVLPGSWESTRPGRCHWEWTTCP